MDPPPGRLDGTSWVGAGDTEHVLEVEKEPTLSGQLLHKMFARKMIQDMEEEGHIKNTEIKELIKDLSLKYNILSITSVFSKVAR